MNTELFSAPYIDQLINACKNYPEIGNDIYKNKLALIFNELSEIEIQGDDDYRTIWITAERGTIEDFGDFEESLESGEVSNEEDFKDLWLYYYPDKLKWYKFSISQYAGVRYFFIDSNLIFQLKEEYTEEKIHYFQSDLIDWLSIVVSDSMKIIHEDIDNYNRFILNNLPYRKRIGRILRNDLWKIFPEDKKDFEKSITSEIIENLKAIKNMTEIDKNCYLSEISAIDFFRFCEIGYDANRYFKSRKKLSAKEKYLLKADGRDCGLTDLNESSVTEFANWYKNERNCGGHPWEICRGGNSTHISLYVCQNENGWYLLLQGSSRTRVVETILIANALFTQKIPFILGKAEEIYNMACGTDYIGIVPENITPRYCHSYFPNEDRIIDFMNLGHERVEEIIQKSYWYPLTSFRLTS